MTAGDLLTQSVMAEHAGPSDDVILRIDGLVKRFGAVSVLDGVSLTVRVGTIHALLGGNGSGKSTTIKILAGVHSADAGGLEVHGEPVSLNGYSPADAEAAGLRFVHQDLGLFDDLSIEENFALASSYPRLASGAVDWKRLRERVASSIEAYGIDGNPSTPINRLRPADRTLVAIARALQDDGAERLIVVLDEPTASLGRKESEELLERVQRRAAAGQTFIIVSHRLQEVLAVSDDFTVFRDGRVAAQLVDAQPSENHLISLMAGRQIEALAPTGSIAHATGNPLVALDGISAGPLTRVNLTVHRGEIVGLAGLEGSGRSTLLSILFGRTQPARGRIFLDGQEFRPKKVGDAMKAGVALVPEDRAREAAFADLSVAENLSITVLSRVRRRGVISRRLTLLHANELIERFHIKVANADALFSSMSGGNQQKTIIARWLQRRPRVLLLDEPTQGVDAMSRGEIYEVIRESTRQDACVIIASSDVAELHALCDRVVVLADGAIVSEVAAAEVSIDDLTALILTGPKPEQKDPA